VNTVADFINGGARYGNVIGNLLGQSGYHTVSGQLYVSGGSCGLSNWKTIVSVGCGPIAGTATFCTTPSSCGGGTSNFDNLGTNSLVLQQNYDVITGASCTGTNTPTSGCVGALANSFNDATGSPSSYVGLASLGTLPPSLVFATSPSFFQSIAFPPIGPDVTGGNLLLCPGGRQYAGSYVTTDSQCGTGSGTSTTAYAGHANANPAMACYLSSMNGPANGSGSVLAFNPNACYAGGSTPPSSTPAGPAGAIFTENYFPFAQFPLAHFHF
jgi:hypothetical protein